MAFKFQQGGVAQQQGNDDLQQQVVALVQAAMQGDQQAQKQVKTIVEAAKKGDQQALQLAQMIQQVVEAMRKQARSARFGAKMDYIHKLRTGANPGEEVVYERKGGKICKKFVKRDCGSGKQVGKDCGGAKVKKAYFTCDGGKSRKVGKKHYFGGSM